MYIHKYVWSKMIIKCEHKRLNFHHFGITVSLATHPYKQAELTC